MRASQENDLHAEKTRRLILALEQKNQELVEALSQEPSGDPAPSDYSERVLSARQAVDAARHALTSHVTAPKQHARNYRIIDPKSGLELDTFASDFEVAPWTANQRMTKRFIGEFALQEQQPDGSWLSYYP